MAPFFTPPVGDEAYQIERSLLCDGSSRLTYTPSSNANRKTWIFSTWVKRSTLGIENQEIFSTGTGVTGGGVAIYFRITNTLGVYNLNKDFGAHITNAVYRDTAAWMHVAVLVDSTQVTAVDRLTIWVNGVEITSFSEAAGYPALNLDTWVGDSGHSHGLFGKAANTANAFRGYGTETYLIFGQGGLTTDDFGEADPQTGSWRAKRYTGAYGVDDVYLPFSNNASLVTLGQDSSGNANNWTLNGFTTDDSVVDTPTNNFCVLNSLVPSGVTYSEGNLRAAISPTESTKASFGLDEGKGYFEVTVNTLGNTYIGVCSSAAQDFTNFNPDAESVLVNKDSNIYAANVHTGLDGLPIIAVNDVIGVAFDATNKKVWWSRNGQWYSANAAAESAIAVSEVEAGNSGYDFSAWTGDTIFPAFGTSTTANNVTVNFGQRPFVYPPPTGFQALSTRNLPDPLIRNPKQHFNTLLYTGTGAAQSITGLDFQPDLVWIKSRGLNNLSQFYDTARGATNVLTTPSTSAESTEAQGLTSFDANGFSIGTDTDVNTSADNLVAWCWKEGVTPGFDIVEYTGNGVSGHTIPHGLGDVPAMMILKNRDAVGNWFVYHKEASSVPEQVYLTLETLNAVADSTLPWNDTLPTSTQFTVGASGWTNTNAQNYIAYLFAEVPGFSKFGTYIGNQSADGPFLWCGFRPAFVIFKRIDSTGVWYTHDAARSPGNDVGETLYPDLAFDEFVWVNGDWFDFVSNGIKIRNTTSDLNSSIYDYVFMAFAEHPFKYANAR